MVPLKAWLLIGAFVAAIAASGAAGWKARDWKCDAAEAKRDAAAEKVRRQMVEFDLESAQLTIMFGAAAQAEIDQRDKQRQERIDELEDLVKKNGAGRCKLGADGVRRLLSISPR